MTIKRTKSLFLSVHGVANRWMARSHTAIELVQMSCFAVGRIATNQQRRFVIYRKRLRQRVDHEDVESDTALVCQWEAAANDLDRYRRKRRPGLQ